MVETQSACFCRIGSTLKPCLMHLDAAGAVGLVAELRHPGQERIFVAAVPDADGLALEVAAS
jgi:hypothetical protein